MLQGFFGLFNSAINPPQFNQKQRLQKIRNQLMTCTYYNNIKFLLERICMDLMKSNPNFNTEVLAFIQNNQPRRFIQIGGIINYQYKNKQRSIQVYMMFNQFFPNKPPYIRVVNYQKKKVNSYYEIYQSPNDKNSYVLNCKLNNLTSWQPGNRCQPIFQQLKYLLQTFPFYQDQIQQQSQKKKKSPQKLKPKQQNEYIANRGSYYQSSMPQTKPQQSKANQNDTDYDQKQCKLCMDKLSTMINTSCGHIMMCQSCYVGYRKKWNTDNLQCPLCKTRGIYVKFVQPKYA